jgi:general secretion pathway protein I
MGNERFMNRPCALSRKPLSFSREGGFTLLEVMISLAVVGGLLITLIYTLNYHLSIAERHKTSTISTNLAKEKMYAMEKNPAASKGQFPDPYTGFSYETRIMDSSFPGMVEIGVVVRDGDETITLSELIRKKR